MFNSTKKNQKYFKSYNICTEIYNINTIDKKNCTVIRF